MIFVAAIKAPMMGWGFDDRRLVVFVEKGSKEKSSSRGIQLAKLETHARVQHSPYETCSGCVWG